MTKKIVVIVILVVIIVVALFVVLLPLRQSVLPGGAIIYNQNSESQPFTIGELSFSASPPSYTCLKSGAEIRTGETPNSCWKTNVRLGTKSYNVQKSEEVSLNEFLGVSYETNAKLTHIGNQYLYEEENDWNNKFSFKFSGEDFLFVSIDPAVKIRPLNTVVSSPVSIRNEFTSFNGGLRVVHTTKKLFGESKETVDHRIKKGINKYQIDIPSGRLGLVTTEVHPFIIIAKTKVFVGEPVFMLHEFRVGCESGICPSGQRCVRVEDDGRVCEIQDPKLVSLPGVFITPSDISPGANTTDSTQRIASNFVPLMFIVIVIILIIGGIIWVKKRRSH